MTKMTKGITKSRLVRYALFGAAAALAACDDNLSPQAGNLNRNRMAATVAPQDDYKISPMDVVEVRVYQVKDLDTVAQVSQTGYISLPLIGDVRADGRSVKQLEVDIAARYGAKYLRSPNVRVSVKDFTSQRFTVEGAVVGPGAFAMSGRTTLLQGIAMARGQTRIADNEVAVFRMVDGKRIATRYDLTAIRDGQAEDPMLAGGDLVVVGESAVKNAWANFKDILGAGTGLAGMGMRMGP
jgi:polysaccharide export outer membrane protein